MRFDDHNWGYGVAPRRTGLGFGPPVFGGEDFSEGEFDVVTTAAVAPLSRSAEELAAAIKATNGKLITGANSSALIVALNNRLRFSVTNKGNGQYEIQDRLASFGVDTNTLLIGGAAVLVLLLVLSKG